MLITIARGIGQSPIVGGFSWGFGDDAVWQFRKAGENIHLVRRNVRFTADKGSPDEQAVKVAYTDSVLFSLPIRTKSPSGAFVVDLTPVFMSDLPQIGLVLPGFTFSRNKIDLGRRRSASRKTSNCKSRPRMRRAAWPTSTRCPIRGA